MMIKTFYDIIPPGWNRKKTVRKGLFPFQPDFKAVKASIIKIAALLLIVSLNWVGLSAVYQTLAYFNDKQGSTDNIWQASILDFELSSPADFSPSPIEAGGSATRTISIINLGNQHKYKISATSFSADACDYFNLEVSLNDGGILYSGLLKDFVDFGPTVFEDPADWNFVLSLPSDAPDSVLGQTCDFDFVFFGSQTRHDLLFGTGFTDIEQISNSIATAICYDSEIRSMGYWMTHSNVYKPYLPQYLGGYPLGEIIDTVEKAQQIFNAFPTPMENMLKKHLLAMKFNLAHFGIGGYLVGGQGKTLDQIVAEADALLLDPNATKDDLEAMKDILDNLNALGLIRYCYVSLPEVTVLVPNGGEQWWVGHYYDITWTSSNLNCPNDDSEVSIWYSRDSGNTWANIVQSTENDGVYNWRAPLYLNGYYVPSSNARIKIVARCSENQIVAARDISDNDFCPPIDYDSLTDEEKAQVEQLLAAGILTEEDITNRETDNGETDSAGTDTSGEGDGNEIIVETEGGGEAAGEGITDKEVNEENSEHEEAPAGKQEPVNLPEEDLLVIEEQPAVVEEQLFAAEEPIIVEPPPVPPPPPLPDPDPGPGPEPEPEPII